VGHIACVVKKVKIEREGTALALDFQCKNLTWFLIIVCMLINSHTFILAEHLAVTSGPSAFAGRSLTVANPSSPVSSSSSQLCMSRHRKKVPLLGKPADQRKALLRALTTEVIRHGRIKTTLVRAKAVRKHVDHMIELGKRGDLHARRQAMAWVYDKDLIHSLFEAAPDRYGEQNGGYTRVLRTVARQGDNAKMAIIELV
jgi:large subunit ribosomal protein L17